MKKIFDNKIVKFILGIIKAILVVLLIMFVAVVCLQKFSNNKLAVFNYRMFVVASGSMEPKYKVGDVLISKVVDPKDVKVDDVISYQGVKGDFAGKIITHQVVSIEKAEDGSIDFHTKGLANIVEDPIVNESQLYGVVVYKIKTLSFVYKIVGTTYGLFLCVVLPIMYIIGSELLDFMLEKEEKRRNNM